MPNEDMCEYLFNHLNGLTRALGLQNSEGGALDAEGFMPSKISITLDFNSSNHSNQPSGNYGMVYFMVLVFIAYMILTIFGASASRPSAKPARNGFDRDERRDQNDPVN